MIDEVASPPLQDPRWQLLAECSATGEPGSEQRLAESIAIAMQVLGLEPSQERRIQQAVQEAVDKAVERRDLEKQNLPISIRVWISGVATRSPHRAPIGAKRHRQRARLGWGFFLVEKRWDALQATGRETPSIIELFLYQERNRPP